MYVVRSVTETILIFKKGMGNTITTFVSILTLQKLHSKTFPGLSTYHICSTFPINVTYM